MERIEISPRLASDRNGMMHFAPRQVVALEGKPWHVAVYSGTFIIVTAIVASGAAKVRESARATTPGP